MTVLPGPTEFTVRPLEPSSSPSTANVPSGAVERNQQRRAADRRERAAQLPAPGTFPAGGDDLFAQVEQLATMHQRGILTDDEFALAKRRLLNG